MDKYLIILRGVSGSGKTTFGNLIAGEDNNIAADDFFYDKGGNYKWNPRALHHAHAYCENKVREKLSEGVPVVVVSNTTTLEKYVKQYTDIAQEYGYKSIVSVVEKRHDGENLHGVPKDKLGKMAKQILGSIKLT